VSCADDLWANWADEPPDNPTNDAGADWLAGTWWRRPWAVYRETAHAQVVIRDLADYQPT